MCSRAILHVSRAVTVTSSLLWLVQACSNPTGIDGSPRDGATISEQATAPLIEKSHEDVTYTVVTCDGFDVIRHFVDDITTKTFFDRAGNPVKVAIHIREQNTLTNSVSGKSVQYPGILNVTIDVPSGTTKVTGTPIHITVPHQGNFIFDAGIVILDQNGSILFEGGPHPFFESGGDPSIFCSLLA